MTAKRLLNVWIPDMGSEAGKLFVFILLHFSECKVFQNYLYVDEMGKFGK